MSRFYLLLGILASALSSSALVFDKFDTGSQLEILRYEAVSLANQQDPAKYPVEINWVGSGLSSDSLLTSVIVTLNENYTFDDLYSPGLEIISKLGDDMCIITGTFNDVLKLQGNDAIKSVSFGNRLEAGMDTSRSFSNMDEIHRGTGFTIRYTGKDVICGLFDVGVDPNHINFSGSDPDKTRVKILYHYPQSAFSVKKYATPEDIKGFRTDNNVSSHGTHTLGIMAGSFGYTEPENHTGVTGSYAIYDESSNCIAIESGTKHPYYGMAPESEIAIGCGVSYESNVLDCLSKMAEYAKEHKKPLVINLSMGQMFGPHDGTDSFARGLERIGRDAIICISAGNNGSLPVSIVKELDADDLQLKTFIKADSFFSGTIDLWSSDSQPVKFELVIVDLSNGEILYSLPVRVNDVQSLATFEYTPTSVRSDVFEKYFTASFINVATADNKTSNQRYNARLELNLEKKSGADRNVAVGIIAEGHPGVRLDVVGKNNLNADIFTGYGIRGWSESDSDFSINSTACGENVVVVGAYSTHAGWGTLEQKIFSNGLRLMSGRIAYFSGYGVTIDGRCLPHIVAPGVSVISSLNSYQNLSAPDRVSDFSFKNRHYTWGAQSGTSMAAPMVSGIIATWLQYNPDLTVHDILDIIDNTAVVDGDCLNENPIKYGAGKIDASRGLQEVIRRSAVGNICQDNKIDIRWLSQSSLEIFNPAGSVSLKVYDTSGHTIKSEYSDTDILICNLGALSGGIYFLNINNIEVHKIIVK